MNHTPPSLLPFMAATVLAASAHLSPAQTPYDGSPYTAWASDYSGSEAHTVGLWKFDAPAPAADVYTGAANPNSYPTAAMDLSLVTTGAVGKFGQAFVIDPSAADSRAFFNPTAGIFHNSALSVELWYRTPATLDTAGWLFNGLGNPSNNLGGVGLQVTNENLILHLGNGGPISTISVSRPTWQAETWYHFAITFENVEGDGVASIYMNGIRLGGDTLENFGNLVQPNRNWAVGNRNVSGFSALQGTYDNFRIADVAYNYAPVPEPGTVASLLLLVPLAGAAHRFLRRK